jgi:hypothetical protein
MWTDSLASGGLPSEVWLRLGVDLKKELRGFGIEDDLR